MRQEVYDETVPEISSSCSFKSSSICLPSLQENFQVKCVPKEALQEISSGKVTTDRKKETLCSSEIE